MSPPMMFGFGQQRKQMLESELRRFVDEMPPLGMTRLILVGDLVSYRGNGHASEIELIVVQETDEPFHRRADFWVTHLRPAVAASFYVYTEVEFAEMQDIDPLLIHAQHYGDSLYG